MPEVIEAHKVHITNPQPETCDLCWIHAPFTEQEIVIIKRALKEIGDDFIEDTIFNFNEVI